MSSQPYSPEELFRLFAETDRKFQDTDRKIRESSAETDRKFQDTDRKIKEISRQIGALGNRLGEFVEEMVRPAAVRLFRERGIEVHEVYRQALSQRPGVAMEIDLLVVDQTELVAIEVKSQLSVEHVNEHLERLGKFHQAFPHYADCKVMGAVAAMVLPDEVARYAYRQGLFVIGQTGDTVEIWNDREFVARVW